MGCSSSHAPEQNNENSDAFNNSSSIKDVELSNMNNIVLNQNVPNPFKEETTISFFIPEDSGYAQIIFTDNLGRILKTVDVNEKGQGQLNVFANDLSNGIYKYSLIVDGKTIDTKNMVRSK
ncbi:MAG: hypothetical protein K0S44_894 [Bacteroidetes bacterium]|jgi:hypothetical protein|nr:hypothetical protein [Bacteroidota bacterium]